MLSTSCDACYAVRNLPEARATCMHDIAVTRIASCITNIIYVIVQCTCYLKNARQCNECCRGHRYHWTRELHHSANIVRVQYLCTQSQTAHGPAAVSRCLTLTNQSGMTCSACAGHTYLLYTSKFYSHNERMTSS